MCAQISGGGKNPPININNEELIRKYIIIYTRDKSIMATSRMYDDNNSRHALDASFGRHGPNQFAVGADIFVQFIYPIERRL